MIFQKQKVMPKKNNISSITLNNKKNPVDNSTKQETVKKGKIIIDAYEYDEENMIGQGATSKVYLGRKCKDHKFVAAIKVVNKLKICKDKQNFDLLKQQMQIHKEIDHPNVVKCYQIIQKNNHYYFILQHCPNGNLDNFIKKYQTLSQSVTTNILQQILSGYKYLMNHKIIHRDLKPPNILKSGFVWKICDFGFSVKGKKNLIGQLNVGTPAYMAPQSLQRNYYSAKTDIFSFGVICYQMLFGTPPWQSKNQKILLQMMLQNKISSQKLQSITNKNLQSFIVKCCQINERKRMSPQQLIQFDFWKTIQVKQQPIKSKKLRQFDRVSSKTVYVKTQVNSTKDVSSNLSTVKGLKQQNLEQILYYNEQTINKEIQSIKIIYEILKNIRQFVFVDHDDKQIFISIFQRHALYIIRRIKLSKYNYLCLKKWNQYIESASYSNQLQLINELSYKIENILKGQTRKKSIVVIRIINRQYDELTYDKMLSNRCINHIKQYIISLLNRHINDEVKNYSNVKKWLIHFLLNYYKYINNYFDKISVHLTKEEVQQQKIQESYQDRCYSQESFAKLLDEIKSLKS